ncbi:hypothetical protein FSARC_10727 [Fusarium sarcochroum]|uniref:PUM-HD domain-containing protein n=1 Tax=Fusarium sarcochroum TaxID=1208366 RepID=A0A8H4TK90_9HYPO|nr:hypothetical protein FSARC_10727 [Fusarium sarcochroum]
MASTRRTYPSDLAMPTGQQPMPASTAFNDFNNRTTADIWGTPFQGARDRSIAPRGMFMLSCLPHPNVNMLTSSLENGELSNGSSALNVNNEPNRWNASYMSRSPNSSPNRTRDGAISNDQLASRLDLLMLQDNASQYSTHGVENPRNSITSYGTGRDTRATSSRQSQSSPSFNGGYNPGHTPSNSTQSQRPGLSQTPSYQNHAANHRAFHFNNKNQALDDGPSNQFHQRLSNAPPFNPTQGFQLNPDTQPWSTEGPAQPRANGSFSGSMDLGSEPFVPQLQQAHRGSIDRISTHYSLEQGTSPRTHVPAASLWSTVYPSRDSRVIEPERRMANQQLPQQYGAFYSNDFAQYTAPLPYMTDPGVYTQRLNPYNYTLGGQIPIQTAQGQDSSKGVRSKFLQEFSNNSRSNRKYELKDIYTHIVEFSGDQGASRFIQAKLDTANSDEKEQVFSEISTNALPLMKDVFGNYVLQKMFEHGNQAQKTFLVGKMKGNMGDLSASNYGCRVVQKAMDFCLVEQIVELTQELEPQIIKLVKDEHANHVIQKIVLVVPREHTAFIVEACQENASNLASNKYACRVVQRVLETCTEEQRTALMERLHHSMEELIGHEYGNYVAQHVIQRGNPEDRDRVIELVMNKLLFFSKHKHASNVVEKCIVAASPEQRTRMRQQFSALGADGSSTLLHTLSDPFGNYVIKKMIETLNGAEKDLLIAATTPHYYTLKSGKGPSKSLQALGELLGVEPSSKIAARKLQVEVDSPGPTPVLTNETNSPQSDGLPSANASAIGVPSTDIKKLSPATLGVADDEA